MGPFSPNWLVLRIARQHVCQAVAQWARGRVLDVGCGAQPYAGLFAGRADAYIGLEPDQRRYAATPPRVWGSALDLPFGAGSFDTVFSSQVLEHLPEPAQALAEMARVLRPGGYLILTAPHIWGVHEVPHDYFRFTGYGLEYLARKAGLQVVEVRAMAGYWVTAGARFCYYTRRFERSLLIPVVRLLHALVQLTAWGLDRLHRVESDAWNWLLVARQGEPSPCP
jgi:SAM-dependent methyltransferase